MRSSEFFGHRIGTPVSTIRDHADILHGHWPDLDDDRRRLAVDTIARQARQLDDTVHEVLTMVAVDAG
ncbi:histidine kinase dimerization/phospho-acceptor domain-containing protein [Dactylosporangium sp. NPDC050688]|uniref:histidine kinase dimerization/phospho-acceptor domain-containing protein n=1 Tax=Dactylosporangium sp. NPDC050688 TaxID=3157217 RepID=UPI0033ECBB3D